MTYDWGLSDYPEKNGLTVMSTFCGGGGSTMGYKLAGYEVIAANDIDKEMAQVYKTNHSPKQFFECSISDLLKRDDLPEVDVLDGSPPCSVFSVAGLVSKAWGIKKKFREGQSEQVLDTLFFEFEKLARKMGPKVVVAENVKEMVRANSVPYAKEYARRMAQSGYKTQVFILDGSKMGLPQSRKRVFFISNRLGKNLNLKFKEPPISFSEVSDDSDRDCNLTDLYKEYWSAAKQGDQVGKFGARRKLWMDRPARTITASGANFHPLYPRTINTKEALKISSFPRDFDFCSMKPEYVMGMSVPPLMMAKISKEIQRQILNGIRPDNIRGAEPRLSVF